MKKETEEFIEEAVEAFKVSMAILWIVFAVWILLELCRVLFTDYDSLYIWYRYIKADYF